MNEVREMLNNMNDKELEEILSMAMACEFEYGHNELGEEFDNKVKKLYETF